MISWVRQEGEKLHHYIQNGNSLCGHIKNYGGILVEKPINNREVCIVCEKLIEIYDSSKKETLW